MSRVEVYTFDEFFAKDSANKVNKRIEFLKRNKDEYMFVVFLLALALTPSAVYADKITSIGETLLARIQLYMSVVVTIMCTIEISSELIKGGRNYFQILYKYGIGYAAMMLAPHIFDVIRGLF